MADSVCCSWRCCSLTCVLLPVSVVQHEVRTPFGQKHARLAPRSHDKCAVTPTGRPAGGIVAGLMRSSQKQTGVKYAQFSLVGASNTLVDVGVFNLFLLIWPSHSPGLLLAYNVAALVLANANSYLWNTLWTFRDQARHDAKQVGMFTAQGLLNVGMGSLLLWLVAHGLGAYTDLSPLVSGNVAKVVSMVIASTMSFSFLRL